MNRTPSPRGSALLVLGALASLALAGAPVAPELGRRGPRVPDATEVDPDDPSRGDSWSSPADRLREAHREVVAREARRCDQARVEAAEQKRERKRADRRMRAYVVSITRGAR